jgi:hypothetical protein
MLAGSMVDLLVGWLVCDYLLLRDFMLHWIMFMIAGVFMTVAMAMLFTDLGLYGILFMALWFCWCTFFLHYCLVISNKFIDVTFILTIWVI